MIGLLLAALSGALAAEHHVVRPGETVASIAAAHGGAHLVRPILRLNRLHRDEALVPGMILELPDRADTAAARPAHVAALRGSGRIYLPTGEQQTMTQGLFVPAGTLVCTDAGSTARIRLAREDGSYDHDEVTLMAETCLRIERLTSRADTRSSTLSLEQGSVSVRESDGDGQIILRSEDGIMVGERGGFRVTLEEEATRTEALDGPVSLIGAGEEVQLAINEGSRVRAGEAPEAPTPLPAGGRLSLPADGAVLYQPLFAWEPVDGALGYRVELSSSPDFSDLLLVEDVPASDWNPDTLFLPFRVPGVWWRVSTFDRVGFLGGAGEVWELSFPLGVGP